MADQADVYVENALTDDIKVLRMLPDNSIDLDTIIASGDVDRFLLLGAEMSLTINTTGGRDIRDCFIKVRSDAGVTISCSRTDANWKIQIVPSDFPPEVPTTVNVEVGGMSPK